MDSYAICSHAEVDDPYWLRDAIAGLNRLTFGHYDGVIVPSRSFVEWYTARPGMAPQLCQSALVRGELVSSVLVTLVSMLLGGKAVQCGIVDEVMTHPDHRRRGLATALMDRALDAMVSAGAEVSLLYTLETDPASGPQRLYESLGYCVYERVDRFVAPSGRPREGAQAPVIPSDDAARAGFAAALGGRDGWLDLDDDLWRWRRITRPRDYPVSIHRAAGGALGALSTGELIAGGRPMPFAVLSDLALLDGGDAAPDLAELVGAAPRDVPLTILCPRSDSRLGRLLQRHGFGVFGTELAMLRALTPEMGQRVERTPDGWYVAVESVIGV